MTTDIALVLSIVAIAVILFVSDKLRVDLVALLVLASLVVTKLVTPSEALSGFSNPAVITVWAVFILSGGLTRTGVANIIGQQVMRLAGSGQFRLVLMIMLTAAVLSAVMNNVGVAALLLPVVIEISKRTGNSPSGLLMPLAFGALLGGLTTMIGTPPNILVSDALAEAGLEPFQLLDFAPVGVVVLVVGVTYMLFLGRRLLPKGSKVGVTSGSATDLHQIYRLEQQLLLLRIPMGSILSGMTLAESRLGSILDLNVLAVIENGETQLSPNPDYKLKEGDQLLVVGRPDQLYELHAHKVDTLDRQPLSVEGIEAAGIEVAAMHLATDSAMIHQTVADIDFRRTFGLNVLAVRRNGELRRVDLKTTQLEVDDVLWVQGSTEALMSIRTEPGIVLSEIAEDELSDLQERLLQVRIPENSGLIDRTLVESRLGAAFGLTVLCIARNEETIMLPGPNHKIRPNDLLLVQGNVQNLRAIQALEQLEIDKTALSLESLETAKVGLAEVVLSPHTTLDGKSLIDIRFRDRYGLNVLALLRGGQVHIEDFTGMPLKFGDAMLVYGPRKRIGLLGSDPDFLVLAEGAQPPPDAAKAPIAVAIMASVLLVVFLGWLPISIAAVIGGTLMVLTRCLSMEELYRFIEWPAVFLIACMLPLGIAMENTGAATFLANGMLGIVGENGPLAVLAGLFILSVLASQVMPNAAVIVLMAPIALASASDLNASPHAFMMGIAIAASASFMSPVSHPANVLVMAPGSYRFSDFIKVGLPLTILILITVMIVLPLVWPF